MSDQISSAGNEAGGPEVIRSEEELSIAMELVETGRARLVKRVETESVTRTIELRREVLEIERLDPPTETTPEPAQLAEGRPASSIEQGPFAPGSFREGVLDIVLMQEEALITVQNVPRERIRIDKTTQVHERAINADLNVERIDLEERAPEVS